LGRAVERKRENLTPRPRAVVCDFCGHPYIRPCTAETEAACPNMIAKREVTGGPQQSIRHHYIPVFYPEGPIGIVSRYLVRRCWTKRNSCVASEDQRVVGEPPQRHFQASIACELDITLSGGVFGECRNAEAGGF
jgi:hypothetical protein